MKSALELADSDYWQHYKPVNVRNTIYLGGILFSAGGCAYTGNSLLSVPIVTLLSQVGITEAMTAASDPAGPSPLGSLVTQVKDNRRRRRVVLEDEQEAQPSSVIEEVEGPEAGHTAKGNANETTEFD